MKKIYYYKNMELTDDDYLKIIENHIQNQTNGEVGSLIDFLENKIQQLLDETKWKHCSFRKIQKQIYLINNAIYENVDYIMTLIWNLRLDVNKLIQKLEMYMSILKRDYKE